MLIDGISVPVIDASTPEQIEPIDVHLTAVLRVSWLSPLFNEVEVSKFVEKFLQTRHAKFEINRIQKECYKDSSIQNGVIKMWVKYDICDHRHVLDLVGIYELCGQMAHIHIAGIPLKCIHCKEFGHIKMFGVSEVLPEVQSTWSHRGQWVLNCHSLSWAKQS